MIEALCQLAEDLGSVAGIEAQSEEVQREKAQEKEDKRNHKPPKPAVELCSMHKSKGLEWQSVFVVNITQKSMPHPRNPDQEEERRLFYVACTRAKHELYVSYSGARPSSYIRYVEPHVGSDK